MSKKIIYIVLLFAMVLTLAGCEEKYVPNSLDVTKTKTVKMYEMSVTIPEEYEEKKHETEVLGYEHKYKKRYHSELAIGSHSAEENKIESAEDYLKMAVGEDIAKEFTLKETIINDIAWTKATWQVDSDEKMPIYNTEVYIALHNGRYYLIQFGYNYKDATYKTAIKQIIESVKFE